MPQYTLLELTQKLLSSMDSDEINSIFDTTEAQQVVSIIQTVYYDIVSVGELPRDDDLFQLVASGDPAKPVVMTLPSDVNDIRWIKYDNHTTDDTRVTYQPLIPMPLIDFIEMVTSLNPDEGNVLAYTHTIGSNSWTLYCKTDAAPRFYTTTDDNTVLFDSYDEEVDTTLQTSKTMCFGQRTYPWSNADSFVPPLDDKQSQRLLHEAKALAFAELKQAQHLKAEKTAREIRIDQQASKHKIPTQNDYDLVMDMGRRPTLGRTKPTGRYK
jgi:hypothetical protein